MQSVKQLVLSLTKKDFEMETFRAGGPGGQNQNKRDTGVRFRHVPSGAVGESREYREQLQNKKAAFVRMANHPRMKIWINKQIGEKELPPTTTNERHLYRQANENSPIERKVDGKWVQQK